MTEDEKIEAITDIKGKINTFDYDWTLPLPFNEQEKQKVHLVNKRRKDKKDEDLSTEQKMIKAFRDT